MVDCCGCSEWGLGAAGRGLQHLSAPTPACPEHYHEAWGWESQYAWLARTQCQLLVPKVRDNTGSAEVSGLLLPGFSSHLPEYQLRAPNQTSFGVWLHFALLFGDMVRIVVLVGLLG